ncbi:hypothetical protein DY245_06405 [Streptomyces inhibens]|uniref:DUF6879 domain-containing protein n=1 Tax=Streptomyces inhibens TaxID=2293571 RepID=A0A371Q8T4_STRIH|nr:DUF6879 family protein [Streptomyces inhibens]REK91088.1 hypothetical protein DY245_06405 [Streptomyces inhibens]
MPQSVPAAPLSFDELLDSAQYQALHLGLRDTYAVGEERGVYDAFLTDGTVPPYDSAFWRPWVSPVEGTVARGVAVRRARIVSEPVTDYVRFEHAITASNIRAGEEVRWLGRRHASALALPGNDFWLIDDRLVRFNVFSGDGEAQGPEHSDDPQVIKLCADAFQSVWERATPHDQYEI